jgi:hypothetical protein
MKRRAIAFAAILPLCAALWLCRCSINVASGTETGNPDITACAKAMAKEALAALHTKNEWQPSSYLDSAALADSMQNVPLTSIAAAGGLSKRAATLADTSPFLDSALIIYDTVVFFDTIIKKDTTFVRDTIPVADTLSKTLPAAGDTVTVDVACKKGSIVICDTAVITDTLLQQRAKAVIRIIRKSDGQQLLYAVTDTLWLKNATDTTKAGTISNPAPAPQWELANVAYIPGIALKVNYMFVSLPPLSDTVSVPANAGNCLINTRRMFLSRSTIAGVTVLSRIAYSEADSTLGISTFYPGAADTAESLSVAYKVDIGKNFSSATDDRLLGISRSVSYKPLSQFRRISLHISPDPLAMTGTEPSSGLASITLTNARGASAAFYGVADSANGLIGTMTQAGATYQVSVGVDGKTSVVKIDR